MQCTIVLFTVYFTSPTTGLYVYIFVDIAFLPQLAGGKYLVAKICIHIYTSTGTHDIQEAIDVHLTTKWHVYLHSQYLLTLSIYLHIYNVYKKSTIIFKHAMLRKLWIIYVFSLKQMLHVNITYQHYNFPDVEMTSTAQSHFWTKVNKYMSGIDELMAITVFSEWIVAIC